MNYKNDAVMQKDFLERNLDGLNDLLSQKLGIQVKLNLEEKKDCRGRIYYNLHDYTNIRDLCGVAKFAFKEIIIGTWGIYWNEDYVVLNFHYFYTHPSGGSNGCELCSVVIRDEEMSIIR